jgi:hypothetical protein
MINVWYLHFTFYLVYESYILTRDIVIALDEGFI